MSIAVVLAGLAFQKETASPLIIEHLDPKAKTVQVQMTVHLPSPAKESPTVWAAVREAIREGGRGWTRLGMAPFLSISGDGLRVSQGQGHFSIGVELPSENLTEAASLIASVFQKPIFPKDKTIDLLNELPFRRRTAWDLAFDPYVYVNQLPYETLMNVYNQTLTPERVVIYVSGPFESGEGAKAVRGQLSRWSEFVPPKRAPKVEPPSVMRKAVSGQDAAIVIQSIPIAERDFPYAVAFATMLGSGKSSAVFRIIREQERLSYKQEACLVYGEGGWRIQVTAATNPNKEELEKKAETAKAALEKEIEGWTEEDFKHARDLSQNLIRMGLLPSAVRADAEKWIFAKPSDLALLSTLRKKNVTVSDIILSDQLEFERVHAFAKELWKNARAFVIHAP